ncbi:MAG: hypothetical protein CMB31_02075 [Euryarchaeota archaeon]|nr:hypothetical protein [Euryarchaeota archaeon]|tara:strand:- start:587 stop:832 length:246 start_codon:yes stop_codon:yes gene_type:complete
MNDEEILTLLGREEKPGKFKNQRLWNVMSLIFGFSILFAFSSLILENEMALNNQTIILLTCFPGAIVALLIAEFLSKLFDR